MFRRFSILFDEPGDGGAGGGPAGDSSTGGAPAGTPTPSPAANPAGTGGGEPAPSTPGTPQYTYQEDRSNWLSREDVSRIISERVGPVSDERNRLRDMLKAGGFLEDGPARLNPQQDEAAGVMLQLLESKLGVGKGQLSELLKLVSSNKDHLGKLGEALPQLQASHELQWAGHGARVLHSLEAAASKALGLKEDQPLNRFQQVAVGNAFKAWVESDPQLGHRYSWGDNKLVTEFMKEWQTGFIDPARRIGQAPNAATAARNSGLPGPPQPGGVAPTGSQGTPGKPKNEDEVYDGAFKEMQAIIGSRS